ncbi:uncharacterized protein LOC144735459 [Lampetra planeri]
MEPQTLTHPVQPDPQPLPPRRASLGAEWGGGLPPYSERGGPPAGGVGGTPAGRVGGPPAGGVGGPPAGGVGGPPAGGVGGPPAGGVGAPPAGGVGAPPAGGMGGPAAPHAVVRTQPRQAQDWGPAGGVTAPHCAQGPTAVTLMSMPVWSSGLFSCYQDLYSCLLGCLCPCALIGGLASKMGESSMLGCPCWMQVAANAMRASIRERYRISGSLCNDLLTLHCCLPCAACQMHREVSVRGWHRGRNSMDGLLRSAGFNPYAEPGMGINPRAMA